MLINSSWSNPVRNVNRIDIVLTSNRSDFLRNHFDLISVRRTISHREVRYYFYVFLRGPLKPFPSIQRIKNCWDVVTQFNAVQS